MAHATSVFSNLMTTLNPTLWYPLNESAGATLFANDSPSLGGGLPVTISASTPLLSKASMLPAVPADTSITGVAELAMGYRNHVALFDVPAATHGVSVCAWARPDTIETGGTQVIISKPSTYQLLFSNTSVRFDPAGIQHTSSTGAVTPGQPMFITGSYFNSGTNKIYVNGQDVSSGSPASNTDPTWSDTHRLEIGGFQVIGSTGFTGGLQHLAVWYGSALSQQNHRDLYQAAHTPLTTVASTTAYAFSWSTNPIVYNALRTRIRVTNDSSQIIYLNLASTATAGAGVPLLPGEYYESPRFRRSYVYVGPISIIHDGSAGGRRIAINEESSS